MREGLFACLAKTMVVGSPDLRGFWGWQKGKGGEFNCVTGVTVEDTIGIFHGKFIQLIKRKVWRCFVLRVNMSLTWTLLSLTWSLLSLLLFLLRHSERDIQNIFTVHRETRTQYITFKRGESGESVLLYTAVLQL
jgi:hypothetical protein